MSYSDKVGEIDAKCDVEESHKRPDRLFPVVKCSIKLLKEEYIRSQRYTNLKMLRKENLNTQTIKKYRCLLTFQCRN